MKLDEVHRQLVYNSCLVDTIAKAVEHPLAVLDQNEQVPVIVRRGWHGWSQVLVANHIDDSTKPFDSIEIVKCIAFEYE
jgi:hypothetical protein